MRLRHIAAWLAALLVALPAVAQEQGGSIQGVVKDAQGGVLPGALVEAKNTQGLGSRTVTNNLGVFRFPSLPPGSYEFNATLTGFSPAKATAIVTLGQLLRVDMTLRVGGVSESVNVEGETPLIDLKANAATASIN